jgi:ribosome biogenesis GTPase / thiamine phosphate phosphatase
MNGIPERDASARVVSQERDAWLVISEKGERWCTLAGRLRAEGGTFPVVGDRVVLEDIDGNGACIRAVLPRKSALVRRAAGTRPDEQVLAANIDVAFIVAALAGGRNFNLRRLERYLTLVWNSGASPVILLNKADLCDDIRTYIGEVENVAPGVPVHAVSALQRMGLETVRERLGPGITGVFLGPSGVGKSALINALFGFEKQRTGEIRAGDAEGRHTTTRRELLLLPGGGCVIDTPGIREIQLTGDEEGLKAAFRDIEELAQACLFKDCTHRVEPGCAVLEAVERGEMEPARLESYHRLRRELERQSARTDISVRLREKSRERQFGRMIRDFNKKSNK